MPFAAIGAIGIETPGVAATSIVTSQSVWPSAASSASTCASDVPLKSRPSRYAKPRCTPSGDGRELCHSTRHFSAHVAASIEYELAFGREVHRAVDDDRAGLHRRHLGQRVGARDAKLRDVAAVDLGERREPVARERSVVRRPVLGRRGRGRGARAGLRAAAGGQQRGAANHRATEAEAVPQVGQRHADALSVDNAADTLMNCAERARRDDGQRTAANSRASSDHGGAFASA